jgi:hypothetical protein
MVSLWTLSCCSVVINLCHFAQHTGYTDLSLMIVYYVHNPHNHRIFIFFSVSFGEDIHLDGFSGFLSQFFVILSDVKIRCIPDTFGSLETVLLFRVQPSLQNILGNVCLLSFYYLKQTPQCSARMH